MSDVSMAVEQDAVANSLLGDQPEQTETVEQTPTGTEATEEVEQVESQGEVEQTDQDAEDWLPSDQDKIFSDDVLLRYATRYQKDEQWLSDPLNRQLLIDKINSDIAIKQRQETQEFEVPEVEQEPTQQQPQAPQTLEEHLQLLGQWAERNTDPRIAQNFADQFMQAFGVTDDKGQPVKATPQVAQALTRTMTTFGMNLIQTALPQMIAPMLDSIMPGFSGMYYQGARATSWDTIRNSSPQFSELPAYGTKEFVQLCAKLDKEYPALTEMGYTLERANGGQLHGPAADKFYSTLAKLATKQAVDPNLLQQAAEAGARNARRGEVRRTAGNLGAGKSNGLQNRNASQSQFQTNQDLFDADTMALYKREHGRL